jgi:ribosomal protein S18 acetylase RimI-like enzyme
MSDEPLIRHATTADAAAIRSLHAAALRELGTEHYSVPQIDAMLRAGTLEPSLIRDGTYFVAEQHGLVCGAGGWTANDNLAVPHGAVAHGSLALGTAPTALPPRRAFIRAVYVHPDFARLGIGRRLVARAERAAAARGIRRLELFAALSGVALYRKLGYLPLAARDFALPTGGTVSTLHMAKHLELPSPANDRASYAAR